MPPPDTKKGVTLKELKSLIKKGPLPPSDIRRYFKTDPEHSYAFLPAVRLNEAMVDTGGAAPTPDEIAKLLEDASRAAKPTGGAPKSLAPAAAKKSLKILAEGDSWFNLPAVLWPPTAIDILSKTHDVRSIAHWSHTLEGMLAAKQYEQPLRSGNFRHFLFSAGGNDVLGSIGLYLKKRKDGDTDPANASKYVKPDFADKIEETIAGFKRLVGDVKEMAPAGTVLFVHGYANAIPKKDGQYLGKRLAAQGFDPVVARDLSRAVVVHMVGMFNDALRHFAATTANVVYIDMRPAMLVSDWNTDEIHPKETGSRKIAARFAEALAENVPVT